MKCKDGVMFRSTSPWVELTDTSRSQNNYQYSFNIFLIGLDLILKIRNQGNNKDMKEEYLRIMMNMVKMTVPKKTIRIWTTLPMMTMLMLINLL